MNNVSIRARLVSLTAALIGLLVASNLYLGQRLSESASVLEEDARLVTDLTTAVDASRAFGDLKYWLLELAVAPRPGSRDSAYRSRDEVAASFDRLEDSEAETVAVLRLEMGALMDSTLIAMEAYEEGNSSQGDAFLDKGLEHVRVVDRRLDGLVKVLGNEVADRREAALRDTDRAMTLSSALVVLGAAFGLVLTFVVLRSITGPLAHLVTAMNAITAGDLQVGIPPAGRDEIGAMARTLRLFRDSLVEHDRLASQNRSTEATLRDTQTRLVDAVESLSEGFSLYDASDRLVVSNSRYHEMVYGEIAGRVRSGATFEEMARLAAEGGIIADAVGREEEWLAERIAAHRNPRGHRLHRHSDGRWLQVSERKTENGATVAVYEDVTEIKSREQELATAIREKDAAIVELHAVLDAIEYGVLFMDADLNVHLTNRAYREIWKIPSEFLPPGTTRPLREYYEHTRPFYDVADEDWEAFLTPRMEAVRAGISDPAQSVRTDGSILQRQCIELADGGRMLTYFDITELKRADAALRRSEERYALAVRGSNDGLWDWDAESDVIYLSPRFLEIAGLARSSDHQTPETWLDLIHPEDLDAYKAAMMAHLRGEAEFFGAEYRIRGEDGRYRWVQTRGLGLRHEDGGRLYRMSGSLTDTTLRKQAEIALRHAKEVAEQATRAKSRFLANMSHELRTPLNAVIGITEMLKEEAEEDQRHELREPLERVVAAGRHLLGLINNILDLSKIEAGRLDLHVESFQVRDVVEDAATTARALAAQNANRLLVHCEDNVSTMRSDVTRVRQILLNLLGNACKFTERGEVSITATRVHAGDSDWLEFAIADTGIGIATDQLEELFEEFTQVDGSSTRRHPGTGLGLPISRRLCELLGGRIDVTSQVGKGTTFTVRLPAEARLREPSPEPSIQA
jgi:PAS domain S-box-containing protein